jgi:succinate dehydrogenase/fumarate reductase flavoprotein subunit
MYASTHELLLVDGGGVGLCAAIAAEELNHKLSIAVVPKVYPTRVATRCLRSGARRPEAEGRDLTPVQFIRSTNRE